jgi:hypothetical protein
LYVKVVRLHRREDPVEETVANKEGEEVVVEVVQPRVAVVRNPRNLWVYALRIILSFVMVVHIVLYQIDQIQDNQHLSRKL